MLVLIVCIGFAAANRVFANERRVAAVTRELETARRIQQSILPKETPAVGGLRVASHYEPMLKLTRHLFGWIPSADLMDFYERGLYNHILASQDSATGGVIYYCPLKPGAFKTFSTPNDAFWCCVGTGMENPPR